MNTPASTPTTLPSKHPYACNRCFDRKVKCNRQEPCTACIKHKMKCIFRPEKPRKKRDLTNNELLVRLRRCEALLRKRGVDPGQADEEMLAVEEGLSVDGNVSANDWKLCSQADIFKPKLIQGRNGTEVVHTSLWLRVNEEINENEAGLEEDEGIDEGIPNDDFSYVLGATIATTNLHPSPETIQQLWKAFIENVNPLIKVIHVPSLQPAIEKAVLNIDRIPRGLEALMFSTYSLAVISLTEYQCTEILGVSRTVALDRFLAATKFALSKAGFMSSTSIIVLQALLLHLLSIRDIYDPRTVWTLTGVAIRVAESMGMRIDGTVLGLPPFETEIRRRIWWQLMIHDIRATELSGQAKFRDFKIDETTPKMPANVNDSDLYPGMLQPATDAAAATEMIWCMFKLELANFGATQCAKIHSQGKATSLSGEYAAMNLLDLKNDFIKNLEDTIETKYLRFCDPTKPLQLKALLGGRCTINSVRFMANHPRRWTHLSEVPALEQQRVWDIVMQLLKQYTMMQSTPQLQCFAWSVPYFTQWPAVIHMLDTLRARPLHQDAEKAWKLIDLFFECMIETSLSMKKPMYIAIGGLCLKAFEARAAALLAEGRIPREPPAYIVGFRNEREAAKLRKQRAIERNSRQAHSERTSSATLAQSSNLQVYPPPVSQPQQYPTTNPAHYPQNWTGDDAFWLCDAVNDVAGGYAVDTNLDAILSQDPWFDNSNGDVIDWAQWDTWIAGADPAHSHTGKLG